MEIDLLAYVISVKPEIDEIQLKKTSQEAQKAQLRAEFKLLKPGVDDEDERVTFFAENDMKSVYHDGLSEEELFTMAQQMICALICFASNESGWVLEKMINLQFKLVKFNPIRGSSYIALPSELKNNRNLLNIRKTKDSKFFLYCYTGAYYMKVGPTLESNSWRLITSSALYNSTNVSAHQPQGKYVEMLMPVDKIDSFETFEQVKVNVFRYHKKQLLPPRVSK